MIIIFCLFNFLLKFKIIKDSYSLFGKRSTARGSGERERREEGGRSPTSFSNFYCRKVREMG